jgi:hypothetical protein
MSVLIDAPHVAAVLDNHVIEPILDTPGMTGRWGGALASGDFPVRSIPRLSTWSPPKGLGSRRARTRGDARKAQFGAGFLKKESPHMIYVLVLGLAPFVVQFAIGAPLACREFQSFSRGIQRPEPPSCIELRFNEDNFQACKIEMEQYRSDIEG